MSRINIDQLWSSATAIIFGRKTTGAGQGEELSAAEVRTLINVADGANVGLPLIGGSLSGALNEAKGADIASATTTDIGAATGNYVVVTGTTTITGLGTVQAGTRRKVNFSGVLILTHNATSLILPTSANITTAAGDNATFISLGSGNWVCTSYQRKDGTALVSAGGGGFDPTTTVEIMEDFINPGVATGTIGLYRWSVASNTLSGVDSSFGVLTVQSPHDSVGGTNVFLLATNGYGFILGNQSGLTVITRLKVPSSEAVDTKRIGLRRSASATIDGADSIEFRATGTGNWYAVTRAASTETATDTGVAQSTSFQTFKIISTGASIGFYIDGVLKATITTNIPTVLLFPSMQADISSNSGQSIMDVDYFYLKITGLTR